jgi:arylsulfatase A-like enzyme
MNSGMNSGKSMIIFFALLLTIVSPFVTADAATAEKPNIVFILADDLGYGDVKCFNPESKIPTPNLDRLAQEGMKFTDAHSSSAVCTPTRYSILTGRYNWRSRLQSGVLGGLSPRLIEQGRLTVAEMLKKSGYRTACIGKWHLGMDWAVHEGKTISPLSIEGPNQVRNVDYSKPIKNGPNSVGFDYYFGIAGSLDMVPYTFIENDHVVELPTKEVAYPMIIGKTNSWTRRGPGAPGFDAKNVLPELTRKSIDFIKKIAGKEPFFLYLAFASPHTPIIPEDRWLGKSGICPYCDFVMATDEAVGKVMKALEESGVADNTIVFFASDNGCSPAADIKTMLAHGHNPSYKFRGTKADIFEGGHRIPFIVRWNGKIKPESVYPPTVCLVDFMATVADIIGYKLPDNAAEDSVSLLPALYGKTTEPIREATVHHSINGSFAIRQGKWKLILCPDSGGWSDPRPGNKNNVNLPPIQLYDLENDIGETKNLYKEHPEVVEKLTKLLEDYVARGRSTPGAPQKNEVPVNIRKNNKSKKQGNNLSDD